MSLKIHATRIVTASEPGRDSATKWQVAVSFPDGNTETFDTVQIVGGCDVLCLPDSAPTPHVYVAPHDDAHVVAFRDNSGEVLQ